MSIIDVIIGLLLGYELFKGLKKGFVAEAGSIIGLVVAFYTASAMRGMMAHFLSPVCYNSETWSSAIGFLVTFLLVYSLIVILAKIFDGFLGVIALGGVNRMAGGLFCLFKGVLIFSIVINLYETIDSDKSFIGVKRIESSILYTPVKKVAPAIFPYFGKKISTTGESHSNDSDKTTE